MDVKEINNGDGTISLCFEIDEELYKQLAEILAPQGLTLEKAIELFLREMVRLGRIPFDTTGMVSTLILFGEWIAC